MKFVQGIQIFDTCVNYINLVSITVLKCLVVKSKIAEIYLHKHLKCVFLDRKKNDCVHNK